MYKQFFFILGVFLSLNTLLAQNTNSPSVLNSSDFLFSGREYWKIRLNTYGTDSHTNSSVEFPKLLSPIGIGGDLGIDYHYHWNKHFSINLGATLGEYPFGYGEDYPSGQPFFLGDTLGSIFRNYLYSYYFSFPLKFQYQKKLKINTFYRLGLGGEVRFPLIGWTGFSSAFVNKQGQLFPRWEIAPYYPDQAPANFLLSSNVGLTHILPNYHILDFDITYSYGINQLMQTDYRFFNELGEIIQQGNWNTRGSYLGFQIAYSLSKINKLIKTIEDETQQETDLRILWRANKENRKYHKGRFRYFLDSLHRYPDSQLYKKIFRQPRWEFKYGSFLSNTHEEILSGALEFRTKYHHSFYFALKTHFNFNPHWGLVLGIDWGLQYFYYDLLIPGNTYGLSGEFWDYDQDFNHFINLPIQLKYSIPLPKNWAFQSKAGISLKKFYPSRFNGDYFYQSESDNINQKRQVVFQAQYKNQWDIFANVPVSVGFQKTFEDFSAISFDLIYNYAPSDMIEIPYTIFPGEDQESRGILRGKNNFIGIEVGYTLPKRKKIYRKHTSF